MPRKIAWDPNATHRWVELTPFQRALKDEASMPEYYEVKIQGHLDDRWSKWFAGLRLTYLKDDVTLLSGILPDQAALHGLLERVRDLNLTLVSVMCGGVPARDSADEDRAKT